MTCPRCQHENRVAAKFCEECGTPLQQPDANTQPAPSYADVQRSAIEALEQQTATAEILRIISSSPTDVQPVLEAVAENAARLCESFDSSIFRRDGDRLLLVAHHGPNPFGRVGEFAIPLTRGSLVGRSIIEHRAVQVTDLQTETEEFPLGAATACQFGYRTSLAVPLLRESAEIGAISIRRTEVRPFTDKQMALLQTFADQAVIAIENVRLFTELQASNRELTDSLTQQTATAEILRVISSSPTDIQPVLEAVTASAARLCEAPDAAIFLAAGQELRLATHLGPIALGPIGEFTVPLVRGSLTGRATLERRTIQLADHQAEEAEYPEGTAVARRLGVHTMLAVPLLRSGEPIGVIALRRIEVRLFTDQQIALLKTFADQAVIAIENVRLFTELQQKNDALTQAHAQVTESLEQQTATSEILRVISSSPTDVQPVFEAIVQSAERLCGEEFSVLCLFDGELVHFVAHHNLGPAALAEAQRIWPTRPARTSGAGRAILDRRVVQIHDIETDPEYGHRQLSRAVGHRSSIYVPMLKDGAP